MVLGLFRIERTALELLVMAELTPRNFYERNCAGYLRPLVTGGQVLSARRES